MTRHVLLFERRFVEPLAANTKRHTIRPPRKRPIKVGDYLHLRYWADKPYRSKQVMIGGSTVTAVRSIMLRWLIHDIPPEPGIEVDGVLLSEAECEELARRDGFDTALDMLIWHQTNYGLCRELTLIEWGPA